MAAAAILDLGFLVIIFAEELDNESKFGTVVEIHVPKLVRKGFRNSYLVFQILA